jgi:poly(3-hydroxybutyrate) depolymerase
MRAHYLAPGVGHYGVFNGSRWRADIAPRVADFIATHRRDAARSVPRKAAERERTGATAASAAAAGPAKD